MLDVREESKLDNSHYLDILLHIYHIITFVSSLVFLRFIKLSTLISVSQIKDTGHKYKIQLSCNK